MLQYICRSFVGMRFVPRTPSSAGSIFVNLHPVLPYLLQTNLHSSMTHNALIRKQYECVQGEYLALKSKMLDELEKNEDTTVTNTDMQEVCYNTIVCILRITVLTLIRSWNVFSHIFHST